MLQTNLVVAVEGTETRGFSFVIQRRGLLQFVDDFLSAVQTDSLQIPELTIRSASLSGAVNIAASEVASLSAAAWDCESCVEERDWWKVERVRDGAEKGGQSNQAIPPRWRVTNANYGQRRAAGSGAGGRL